MNIQVSRPKLNLVWKAKFADNSELNQFDGTNENKFKKVQDRFNDLTSFELSHISKPLRIAVDLRRGLIFINNMDFVAPEIISDKENIRLIYLRRNRVETDIKGEIISHKVYYFIGFQYNDKLGKNHKILLNIDQEGNIVIGD